jgi:hypothetical protein
MTLFKRAMILVLITMAIGCGQHAERTLVATSGVSDEAHRLLPAKRSFRLLRKPRERLPRGLRLHLAHLLGSDHLLHAQPQLAQQERTHDGVAWVFSDKYDICLAQGAHGAVTCTPIARARREGVSSGAFSPPSPDVPRPHDFLMMGLAPNRVEQVVITIGKRRNTIKVQSNLFSASGDAPILIKRFVRRHN